MKFKQAMDYAEKMHHGQIRKGTDIPYIVHPRKVMEILMDNKCSDEVIIAGILHDTLEDTPAQPEEIEILFGKEVLVLIQAETEDKTRSWKERKAHTINHLANSSLGVKLICCADKLSNLLDMIHDFESCGEKLWERFNAPDGKDDIAWYYKGIKESLHDLKDYKMYKEYCELCKRFF